MGWDGMEVGMRKGMEQVEMGIGMDGDKMGWNRMCWNGNGMGTRTKQMGMGWFRVGMGNGNGNEDRKGPKDQEGAQPERPRGC